MLRVVVLVFLCVGAKVCSAQGSVTDTRVVNTTQGLVRGHRLPPYDIFTFYDIPYATAPKGADRFKGPLPPPSWSGIFDAVSRLVICPQPLEMGYFYNITEDCLVASVFVPDTNRTNLPVLVSVHGGGYVLGTGNLFWPFSLVDTKEIIAVTFNYRVGIHGFLCLGNEDAPGNAGMKDQVALLRWVRENIARFGGNPDDVTVGGCSAGGSSVDLLILSKLTDGLMHKAMPESGSSVGSFGVAFDPLQTAKEYAFQKNFTNVNDINALSEFYKSLSFDELVVDSLNMLSYKDSSFGFVPCVERDIGQDRFLEDAPINILRSLDFKKIPMFYGFANMEGAFRLDHFYEWQHLMNNKFSDFLPADLEFESKEQKEEIASKVKQHYFGNNSVSNGTIMSYVDYFSDVLFIHGMLQSAALQVEAGNREVYLFEYSFAYENTPVIPHTTFRGADHCDQQAIVMDSTESHSDYVVMQTAMRDLWLNFITTGNPTSPGRNSNLPLWPPTGRDRTPHYSLGNTIQVSGVPRQANTLFWDAIYQKHYRVHKAANDASALTTFPFIYALVFYIVTTINKLAVN